MPLRAKLYIGLVLATGTISFGSQLAQLVPDDATRFSLYLLVTVLTSGLKVQLPMIMATLSVNYLFILVGIVVFNLPQAMILGAAGTLTQCLWRPRVRPQTVQILFSCSSITLAVMAGHRVFHGPLNHLLGEMNPLLLLITAAVYFLVNSVLVAGVIALTERRMLHRTWYETCFWVSPYYLAAASIAWLIVELSKQTAWSAALVLFPLVFFIYRSYGMYLDRLEKDKGHAEEMAGLHLRTIEALALAIEAKDATTHDHLQRVRVYAMEIGREMGLAPTDLDALQAAELPAIEVHLSNIFRRDAFRHHSYISLGVKGVICGLGARGYELALEAIADHI